MRPSYLTRGENIRLNLRVALEEAAHLAAWMLGAVAIVTSPIWLMYLLAWLTA